MKQYLVITFGRVISELLPADDVLLGLIPCPINLPKAIILVVLANISEAISISTLLTQPTFDPTEEMPFA